MKNSIWWILLYITLLVAIVFFEYKKNYNFNIDVSVHKYKIKENKTLDSQILGYIKPLDITAISNKQWGILPKKVKKIRKVKKIKNIIKPITVTLKEKVLCIEKECFKLLGIFQQSQKYYASFYYNKKTVKDYLAGEMLSNSIKIKSIMKKSIVFGDINSTREWSMTLFDVNSSKYKPKELKQ